MDLIVSIWIMMIGSFVVQYLAMSLIMTNSYRNITFSVSKFYISVVMSLFMGIIEVAMFDYHHGYFHGPYYLGFVFLLVVFIYLYRNQMYISDKDYLQEMIEHHSMAILTSEEILDKEPSPRVKRLAENIINTQQKEIEYMKSMVKQDTI